MAGQLSGIMLPGGSDAIELRLSLARWSRAASAERHPNNSWNQLVVAKEKVMANQNNAVEE